MWCFAGTVVCLRPWRNTLEDRTKCNKHQRAHLPIQLTRPETAVLHTLVQLIAQQEAQRATLLLQAAHGPGRSSELMVCVQDTAADSGT